MQGLGRLGISRMLSMLSYSQKQLDCKYPQESGRWCCTGWSDHTPADTAGDTSVSSTDTIEIVVQGSGRWRYMVWSG